MIWIINYKLLFKQKRKRHKQISLTSLNTARRTEERDSKQLQNITFVTAPVYVSQKFKYYYH